MSIATIDNIKQLRAQLDAPYQDCVKALEANENNIAQASQWLKEKGRGATRDAKTDCGAIGYYIGETSVSLVPVKCETDFVAINSDFIALADELAKNLNAKDEQAVDKFKEKSWTFKENINVDTHIYGECSGEEKLAVYVHHNRSRAAIVRYIGDNVDAAKKIAMQICAMKPTCVSKNDLNQVEYQAMLEKAKQEARDAGKPEAILDKIADGKVNSQLKEFVLLEQPMFDDAKMTVGQFAQNSNIQVLRFTNVVL